jgi:hypothetical protein
VIARVAIAASVAAEALAFYTLAEWIAAAYGGAHPHTVPGVAFVVVAFVGFVLPQIFQDWELSSRTSYAITGVAAYLLIFGALHLEFGGNLAVWDFRWATNFISNASGTTPAGGHAVIGAALLMAMWVRAGMKAAHGVELEFIPRAIGLPFSAVMLIAILGAVTDRSGEIARATVAADVAVVLALAGSQLALSGATIGDVRAGGVTATLIGATVGATVVCVLVFGTLFTVGAAPIASFLGTIVGTILTIILEPFAWAMRHLFMLLFQGRDPLGGVQPDVQQAVQDAKQGQTTHSTSLAAKLLVYGLRIFALLIAAGIVVAATVIYARLRRRRAELREEAAARGTAGSLGEDLRSLLGAMFHRGSSRYLPPTPSPTVELYREVLRRAEEMGRPRDPAETADEYSPALAETLRTEVTTEITRAFKEARYAGREPDPATVSELQRRWKLR